MRLNGLLDLVFPPRCGGCGRPGGAWCADCAASLRRPAGTRLEGVPLIAAAQLAGSFQRAIHAYKYGPRPALSGALARPLADAVRQSQVELAGLTFVPLHPSRARQRGFNQAERLAGELCLVLSLPLLRGLERVRPTRAQVGLSGWEREANVSGAFRWVAAGRAPTGVGLVDDVCTTGATLRAVAAAIDAAGGSVGAFLVLAVPHTLAAPVVTLPE